MSLNEQRLISFQNNKVKSIERDYLVKILLGLFLKNQDTLTKVMLCVYDKVKLLTKISLLANLI
jgi:hypothetical protein